VRAAVANYQDPWPPHAHQRVAVERYADRHETEDTSFSRNASTIAISEGSAALSVIRIAPHDGAAHVQRPYR
jgi:hypothetical protein